MADDTMTLTVPAKHRDAFRLAVLREIQGDARAVCDEAVSLGEGSCGDYAWKLDDIQRPVGYLQREVSMLARLEAAPAGSDVEVEDTAENLSHMCSTMARITGTQIQEPLRYGPIDMNGARPALEDLSWALTATEKHEAIREEQAA